MKLDPMSYGYKAGPPYTKEELEQRNEFVWKKLRYVKIPQIPGRIRILPRKDGKTIFRSVEYIYERSRKKKEHAQKGEKTTVSMNRKAIIGSEVGEILEGWMVPTENYDLFFDADGRPIPQGKQAEGAYREGEPTDAEAAETATEHRETEDRRIEEMDIIAEEAYRESKPSDAETAETVAEDSETEDRESEETDIQATEDVQREPNSIGEAGPEDLLSGENRKTGLQDGGNVTAVPGTSVTRRGTLEKLVMQALEETKKEIIAKDRKRLAQIPEDEMTEAEKRKFEHLKNEELLEQREKDQQRLCILTDMQLHSIEAQAKKNPDDFLSGYKVRKLNQLLAEIQELFKETEYAAYLELMPKPITDENGYIVEGITNSDATILLNIYATALHDFSVFY